MNQNLKLRVMTVLVGAPLLLYLLLGAGIEGVAFLAVFLSTCMLYEFSKLFFNLSDRMLKTGILLSVNLGLHGLHYWTGIDFSSHFLVLAPFLIFFLLFLFMVPALLNYRGADGLNSSEGESILHRHVEELKSTCFGWIYCGWTLMLLVVLARLPQGQLWILFMFITIWASDTGAYFVGKGMGSKKLFDSVSPKKTWEGFFGGTVAAMAISGFFAHYFLPNTAVLTTAILAFILCVMGTLGDLSESLLKRAAKVKDSGGILPGHGGFLDRFDAVIFALPVMYLFLTNFV